MSGEDQTGIRYSPGMWILPHGGRPGVVEDHVFVGLWGSVKVEAECTEFHIGADTLGELVCEASLLTGKYWDPYIFIGGIHHRAIPDYVLRSALDKALDKDAGEPDRQRLIVSLIRTIPDFAGIEVNVPSSVSIVEVFDATISREAVEAARDATDEFVANLRKRLGID